METETPKNIQVSGNPIRTDEKIKQIYIDSINQHIELLERKKRMIENQFMGNGSSSLVSGIIHGLNFAIEQLYHDINHLKG